jgi:preprotein translocase subunit YajC
MTDLISWLTLLAQEAQEKAPAKGDAPPPGNALAQLLIPMVLIGVVWYFILLRPQMQERKKAQSLRDSVKKNDKVVTIGGIIGTVTNLSSDGREVTIRIDDNAKMKMLRSSIQTVLTDENKADTAS